MMVAKYDYYLEDWTTHYLGINASVEADKVADINLRSYQVLITVGSSLMAAGESSIQNSGWYEWRLILKRRIPIIWYQTGTLPANPSFGWRLSRLSHSCGHCESQ